MSARPDASLAEFTLKAVVVGVVLGIVFGAANAYLGLRVGMTISASIPAAVMAVAVFRALRMRATILEANLSQTIGSASTSLATGTIFTLPALFLWGVAPPYLQVVALAFLGGVLGIAAMIPLRRLLVVREHATLPYPEGTACAEVLRATTEGASGGAWIFRGMALGAAVKVLLSVAWTQSSGGGVGLIGGELAADLGSVLPKARLAVEISPALLAVGYILGFRQAGVCVAGALISALCLTPLIAWLGDGLAAPLAPETTLLVRDMTSGQIWRQYVRYVGAGSVAAAGILTVLRGLPAMYEAVSAVVRGLTSGGAGSASGERTDRDLPGWVVVAGVFAVVAATALVPGVLSGDMDLGQRTVSALGVGVFGVLFVTVAARIVGIVGVTSQPTSGITLVTLLGVASVFVWRGWTTPESRYAVLTVGTIVAIAASKAGDISQDLKTGWLVGATPARQQFGQLIGAACACWAVGATLLLLGNAFEFGSKELPAPQATLMKTIIEGLMRDELPWDLVLTGVGLALGAVLCGVSGLAFAIGVYLPLSTMAPLFLGGCVRRWAERARGAGAEGKKAGSDPGILAASGLVAGEGLAGILAAALVAVGALPSRTDEVLLGGVAGELALGIVLVAVGLFLFLAARARRPEPEGLST